MKKQNNQQLQIAFKVVTDKNLSPIEFTFEHTEHSYLRACQRGFNQQKIVAALQYGESIYKQGLIYFILGENNIPDSLSKQKKHLKNTVVIVSGKSNQVITCYRSANPFKNIRIKSEKLCKNYNHAA
ncbi:MAG: hypothetical protein JST10_03875 [Bacteroidetes bacterium]|nr:hypothetical protein [Bacteroidota bacterium]